MGAALPQVTSPPMIDLSLSRIWAEQLAQESPYDQILGDHHLGADEARLLLFV